MHLLRKMMRSARWAFGALAACLVLASAHAESVTPRPFTATYAASYRGYEAGNLTFSLQHDATTGRYVYSTTADPSFLARLVVSRAAVERSEMLIDDKGVRPLEWRFEDGKAGDTDDGLLTFDWETGRVSGTIEREKIDLPLQENLQDRLSIQIYVTTALLRGAEPGTIPMVDDNRIKQYSYTRKGPATLETALGTMETVLYESTREGSSRVARFWMAPQLGYLPVRAEQVRKGKVETVMEIKSLDQK